jgi:hypothetical protein
MAEDLHKRFTVKIDSIKVYNDKSLVAFSQGDVKTAILIIELTENDKALDLTGKKVRAAFRKADGKNVMQDQTTGVSISDAIGGKVQVVLSTQVLAAKGNVRGQLSITDEAAGLVAETVEFGFTVRESLLNSSIVSLNELPIVEKMIEASEILETVDMEAIIENNERMDGITTQLAQNTTKLGDLTQLNTTDKSSVVNALKEVKTQTINNQSAITGIGNLKFIGVYATVTALQTAYPTGTNGIALVTANGYGYYWNGSAWTQGALFQSTGIPEGNLFDASKVKTGGYYRASEGAWITDATYNSSDFTEVLPNETYHIKSTSLSNSHVVFWDKNKKFISGVNATATNNTITVASPNNDNVYYMTFLVMPAQVSSTKLFIGNVNGNYKITDLLWSSIRIDKPLPLTKPKGTTFLSIVDQLFDSTKVKTGGYYRDGIWTVDGTGTYVSSDFIEVDANLLYDISSTALNIGHINFWDKNKVYLSKISPTLSGNTYTLTVPNNAEIKYMTFLLTSTQTSSMSVVPQATWYKLDKQLSISDIRNLQKEFDDVRAEIGAIESTEGLQWYGKQWLAFGTSITSTTQGKYVTPLATLSGMNVTNYGIPGGTIGVVGGVSNGNILTDIKSRNLSGANLITLEGFVNDFVTNLPLGQIGDTTNSTFAGALYDAITYIQQNSNATLVVFTEHTGQLFESTSGDFRVTRPNSLGLYQYQYNDMTVKMCQYLNVPVIRAGEKSMINQWNPEYLIDHIHHTELGGEQYANTIWDELKMIHIRVV